MAGFAVLSLPLLTGTGTSWHVPGPYDQIGEAALSLPALTISATSSGVSATAALTMPSMTSTGVLAQSGYHVAALSLPQLTATGTILHGSACEASLVLPSIILDADLVTGWVLQGSMSTPALEISASNLGATAEITLSALTIDAEAITGFTGTAALRLPAVTISATLLRNITGVVEITLPSLNVSAYAGSGNAAWAAISLPFPIISATLATGFVLTAENALPALTITASGYVTLITGTANLVLPALIVEGNSTQDIIADIATAGYKVFAFNIKSMGLTEYDNFGFNSFIRSGNAYLAANESGIFLLGADTDATADIEAEISKQNIDMGTNQLKRAEEMFVGLREGSKFLLEMTFDDDTGNYSFNESSSNPHTRRVKLGKGLKARYFGFNLQNEDGGDFSINDIELILSILGRKER